MPIERVNWLAVIVGALIFFFYGYLWYGLLFAKQWTALEGLTGGSQTAAGATPYIVSGIVALILSFGVAVALSHDDDRTPAHGAQFGIFMGIFFIASLLLQKNMYEAKPWQLWAIDAGYAIIGLVILGLLHGGWKKAPAAKT